MNKFFTCLKKRGTNVAKYVIFSVFFSFAFLLTNITNAKAVDYKADKFSGGSTTMLVNGVEVPTGAKENQIGNIGHNCTDTTQQYKIIQSNHSGNGGIGECVSYTSNGKTFFYLQVNELTPTENTIDFKINNVTKLYSYITIFEPSFSLSDPQYDYDQYRYTTSTTYVGDRIVHSGSASVGTLTVSGSEGNYTLDIHYNLRDASFGAHNLLVYFYDTVPSDANRIVETKLSYILAKPISEYEFTRQ